MPAVKFTNNATTTLAVAITSSAVTIVLAAGSGALFPTLAAGQVFYARISQNTINEIVEVTARATDTLTVVRGVDATSPAAFSQGAVFAIICSAAVLNSYEPALGAAYVSQARALGTTFTNNTGSHLFVLLTTSVSVAGLLTAVVGGANVLVAPAPTTGGWITFPVPPGATYRVNATGTQTITTWFEL